MLQDHDRVLIRQVKEWAEILLSFETRNRYELRSSSDEVIGYAAEEAQGFSAMLARNFLGPMRATTIHVYDAHRREVLRGEKPFRFYFHRMEVFEGTQKIGAVERRFSILHRIFSVENATGQEVLRIESPLFRIWTFKLVDGTREIGRISKQWGGLLREAFSDADTFGIEFPAKGMGDEIRKVLLVATFLVDFVCFENNNRRS